MALEFNLVMKLDDSLEQFCIQWEKWENAIIDYSKASTSKPAYRKRLLDLMIEDDLGTEHCFYNYEHNY